MRLNRLDLIRYGRFQDAQIVFPKPSNGQPDVTVIFGANEAGKSTSFNGLLDVLFGFKGRAHPYAFRFERRDLLIGAEIDLPGRGPTALRRNSKPKQSLLDAQDRPLDEALLSSALHGLTRDSYEERFSLNEQSLREGGARIAGAQGHLGQLLYMGLSGLTGMAQTLDQLEEQADSFHKKRGRGTVLKTGLDRVKEIDRELRATRLTTERENALRKDRDQSATAFDAADAGLQQAYQRQAASKAALVWYTQTSQMTHLAEALQAYPDGPDLAQGTAARVAGLVEKITALELRITEAESTSAQQEQIIADNPVDPLAAPLRAELERLDNLTFDGAPLIGRASSGEADLDRRREDRDALQAQIDAVLMRLDAPNAPASALALEADDLERLTASVQACLSAQQSVLAATDAVKAARAQHGDAPPEPQDLTVLRAAFDIWKNMPDPAGLKAGQAQAAAYLSKVTAGLPAAWAELVSAGLPAADTLEEMTRNRAALIADLASAQKDLEARTLERAQARADLATQEAAPDTVDLAKTEATRRARDVMWQQHKSDLSGQSAGQFEAAMHADDDLRAHYLMGAEARQRLSAAQGQLQNVEARYEIAKACHEDLIARQDAMSAQSSRVAQALGFDPKTAASAFAARHQALLAAAQAAAELSIAQTNLRDGLAEQQAAREALATAALSAGLDPDIADLPNHVQRALTLEESACKAWAQWQAGAKTIAGLEAKAKDCRDAFEKAQAQLDQITAPLPLPDRGRAAIEIALPHLRTLQHLHGAHQKLSLRIEALEQAVAALGAGAERLALIMGTREDETAIPPVQRIDLTRARVNQAAQAEEKRAQAHLRAVEIETSKRRDLNTLETAKTDLEACFLRQGGQELAPLDRVAKLDERDRLRTENRIADRLRQEARDGADADLFSVELARMPDATRAAELDRAAQDAMADRDTALTARREADRLYREAYEATDRSDLATEQATLREELRSGARRAAVARLGVLAARGALRRLAAEQRSDMLQDVEAAFVTMTAPAWQGVDVWSQTEGEKLVGIQTDGNAVPVEQMSTGTMGQLYFALRLAGYRSFARDAGALPMILDDIMETFDDIRARAALQLCAEIGTTGQAILFTHHAHLVELARDCIDGVSVVNMPD